MARFIAVWTLGCVLAAAGPLAADEAALEQSYGNGVHAYFSGDHSSALSQFNEAIDGGFKDARAYFFRGLTQMRMGKDKEAQADFQTAATLESADPDRSSTISKSLQRVQGQTRLKIEQYRNRARMAALQEQRAKDNSRFGKARAEERKAVEKHADDAAKSKDADLFDDAKKPMEDVVPEEKADPKPAEKADDAAEGKPDEAKSAEKPAEKADTKPKEEAVDDPFKDDPDMKKEDAKPAEKADDAAAEKKTEEKPAEKADEAPADKTDEKAAEKADE
jgi:hypothetical protein